MARALNIRQALPGVFRFLRHFFPYLRKHSAVITLAMGALILQTAFSLLEPWPLKFVIDLITDSDYGKVQNMLPESISNLDTGLFLMILAISLVIITSLRALSTHLSTISFALVGNRVLTRVREDLFRHMLHLSMSYHDKARSGDLVMRLLNDIGMVREVAVTAVLPMLGNIFILLGMLAVMLWLNWQLTLVIVLIIPLLWFATVFQSGKIQQVSRKNRKREGAMAATAVESMGAIKTVQALTLEKQIAKQFSSQNNKSLKEGVKAKRLTSALERLVDVQVAIALALVLWMGAHQVLAGHLSPGELIIFVFYLRRVFRPLRDFAKYTSRLAKASASGERVLEVLQHPSDIQNAASAITAPAFRGDIHFRNVSFAYQKQPILKNLDLHIHAGETLAIVGKSGGGKTTLSNLLLRLYDPNNGAVLIDGRDIRQLELDSLRSQMSIVLQDGLLFSGTIFENIAVNSPHATLNQVMAAARVANAHEFIENLPQAYETQVGERGATLSGGQQQRIALARAALQNTPILILDEPTTGLDKKNEKQVSEALARLAKDRTTLYISHRLETAKQADRVALLIDGELQACASHAELVVTNSHYRELFQLNAPSLQAVENYVESR